MFSIFFFGLYYYYFFHDIFFLILFFDIVLIGDWASWFVSCCNLSVILVSNKCPNIRLVLDFIKNELV